MKHSIVILFAIIYCCTIQKTIARENIEQSFALMSIIENYDSIIVEAKYAPKYNPSTDTIYYNVVVIKEKNDLLICVDGSKYENYYYLGPITPQPELLKEVNVPEKNGLTIIGHIVQNKKKITIYADHGTEMTAIQNLIGNRDYITANLEYIKNFECIIDRDPYVCVFQILSNMSIQLISKGKPYIMKLDL